LFCIPARLSRGARTTRSPLLVRPPGTPDGGRTRPTKKPRARFRGRGFYPFRDSVQAFIVRHPAPRARLWAPGYGEARPSFPGSSNSFLAIRRWSARPAGLVARSGRISPRFGMFSRKSFSFQALKL
jgi:hypothetical protein